MIDPTPNEIAAIAGGGQLGGEYLESIGKTDLAALTADEWRLFCTAVVGGYVDCLVSLASTDRQRLQAMANGAGTKTPTASRGLPTRSQSPLLDDEIPF